MAGGVVRCMRSMYHTIHTTTRTNHKKNNWIPKMTISLLSAHKHKRPIWDTKRQNLQIVNLQIAETKKAQKTRKFANSQLTNCKSWAPYLFPIPSTIDRGIRTTSRHFSFEFLFMNTQGSAQTENGFGFVVKFRVGICISICHGDKCS